MRRAVVVAVPRRVAIGVMQFDGLDRFEHRGRLFRKATKTRRLQRMVKVIAHSGLRAACSAQPLVSHPVFQRRRVRRRES